MNGHQQLQNLLFSEDVNFSTQARAVLMYQLEHNGIYRMFYETLCNEAPDQIDPDAIPMLPIRAFKEGKLYAAENDPELEFKSSGTGRHSRSRHLVSSADLYRQSIHAGIRRRFDLDAFTLLCYAPGYASNPHSSLLWMLNELVASHSSSQSTFLPVGKQQLLEARRIIQKQKNPVLIFGAAFGLLDLLEPGPLQLPEGSCIIETGGMKTYRREMSKQELRRQLSDGFSLPLHNLHSEYGMCELLSQCYAKGSEWFEAPPWMAVSVRNPDDPSEHCKPGEEGKLAIIDLANIYSCPFLLTDDKGVMDEAGRFQVLGRWKGAELRGCNFLIDTEVDNG
ncbi:MAG: hypothetical protein ACNA78_00050 [Balneolaceae bacterium]